MIAIRPFIALLAVCATLSTADEPPTTITRMQSVLIPSLSFKNVSLKRALDQLCKESIHVDPDGVGITILLAPENKQIPKKKNVLMDPFADGDWEPLPTKITLTLNALSVFESLALILEEANVTSRIQGHVVWVGKEANLPGSPPPLSVHAMPRTAILDMLQVTEGWSVETLPPRLVSLTHIFTFSDNLDSTFYTYDPVEERLYVHDPSRPSVESIQDIHKLFTRQEAAIGQTMLPSLTLSNANANAVSAALSQPQMGRQTPVFSYLKGRELTRSTTLTSNAINLSTALSVLEGLHGWRHTPRHNGVIITSGDVHDYELIHEQLTLAPRFHTLLETQSARDYVLSLGISVETPARIRYIPHTQTLYLTHTPAIIQLIRDINHAFSHD